MVLKEVPMSLKVLAAQSKDTVPVLVCGSGPQPTALLIDFIPFKQRLKRIQWCS